MYWDLSLGCWFDIGELCGGFDYVWVLVSVNMLFYVGGSNFIILGGVMLNVIGEWYFLLVGIVEFDIDGVGDVCDNCLLVDNFD